MGGTFDLSSLCGCGSDCADCCGISTVCCGPTIPLTLYADVNQFAPGCAVSTITLTYDGSTYWTGSGSFACGGACGSTQAIYIRVRCLPATTWELQTSCDNFVNTNNYGALVTVCSPFQLTFAAPATPLLGCATCASDTLTVVVYQ